MVTSFWALFVLVFFGNCATKVINAYCLIGPRLLIKICTVLTKHQAPINFFSWMVWTSIPGHHDIKRAIDTLLYKKGIRVRSVWKLQKGQNVTCQFNLSFSKIRPHLPFYLSNFVNTFHQNSVCLSFYLLQTDSNAMPPCALFTCSFG